MRLLLAILVLGLSVNNTSAQTADTVKVLTVKYDSYNHKFTTPQVLAYQISKNLQQIVFELGNGKKVKSYTLMFTGKPFQQTGPKLVNITGSTLTETAIAGFKQLTAGGTFTIMDIRYLLDGREHVLDTPFKCFIY